MRVSVIIVNWNGKEYLKGCLDSLKEQTFKDFEVIFVDNASTDGSLEVLKNYPIHPRIRLILNEANRGFAGGNNVGWKEARGDSIVLLNTDTVAEKTWLENLVRNFEESKADIAFSMVLSKYDSRVLPDEIRPVGTTTVLGHAVTHRIFSRDFSKPTESCFAGGNTMTFKRELGPPFDDDYFLYAEDVAFSWRTRLRGGKIVLIPNAVVQHIGEGSSKNLKQKAFYQQRNRLMNLFIFYEMKTLLKLMPLIIFNMVATGFKDFPYRWKANLWLIWNWQKIDDKRVEMQALRKVPDSEITPMMSGKFFDGFPILNSIQQKYLNLVGVKTIDSQA